MAGSSYVAEQKSRRKKRWGGGYDFNLLFLTFLLICFGFVMIYSTSSYTAQVKNLGASFYMIRQMRAAGIGLVLMIFVSLFDYKKYIGWIFGKVNLAILAYLAAIVLQAAVLVVGQEINGAKRWIAIGPLSFQPSDFSKIAVILFVAYLAQKNPKALDRIGGFIKIMLYTAPLIGLIAAENLSTAVIVTGVTVGICYVTSRKNMYFIVCVVLLAAAAGAYIFLGEGFRAERIAIWQNVETHEKGFQILQGLYAIASGGLGGVGLGESRQKLGYIPEAQNDMIFSIICEELGLFGAIMVVLLFVLLLWRIFVIARSANDMYGGLLCSGVLIHVALQVVLNIAVVTNSIPSTGVALPFISYGGTSVSMLMIEIGLVLSVSRQIRVEKRHGTA